MRNATGYGMAAMHQWYYTRRGQRQGPVERTALEMLARTGGLAPDDLVWTDGMTNWAEARTIDGLFAPLPEPANPYASPASMAAPPATIAAPVKGGGELGILDPPARLSVGGPLNLAVAMLKKDFGMILVAGIVYLAVIFGVSAVLEVLGMATRMAGGGRPDFGNPKSIELFLQGGQPVAWVVVSNIVQQVVGTFMALGLARVGLDVIEGRPVQVARLFGQGRKLVGAFVGSILVLLMVAAPALLVAVPGLVLAGEPTPAELATYLGIAAVLLLFPGAWVAARFGFFQVAMVDRGMGMADAFRESLRLTRTNVWMVILLYVACALINVAGVLLLCVGLVFTVPLTTLAWYTAYKWMLHGPAPLARIHGVAVE